jgi:hypothetical protein
VRLALRAAPFLLHRPQIKGEWEWRVVSGRPLDAGSAYLQRLQGCFPVKELFRWTLAGRSEFFDDGSD